MRCLAATLHILCLGVWTICLRGVGDWPSAMPRCHSYTHTQDRTKRTAATSPCTGCHRRCVDERRVPSPLWYPDSGLEEAHGEGSMVTIVEKVNGGDGCTGR